MTTALVSIRNLKTYFHTDSGVARAVDDVSFDIPAGRTVALVGESGCGKSVTALSIMRLIPEPPGEIHSGQILFGDQDVLKLSEKAMRKFRGNTVSMIFQEPMTSLNPVFRVGDQVAASMRVHRQLSKPEARKRTIDLFAQVGIPSPESRVDDYSHQMSGGMRQRAMIAMALACDPKLLIADEPTTALDVTIQAQILDLLRALQAERNMSLLLITHDLGVVAEMAEDVAIMYAGKIVEKADVNALFRKPHHPYTIGLFRSIPNIVLKQADDATRTRLYAIKGQVPPATAFPSGCRFHPRCPFAMDLCRNEEPPLEPQADGRDVACWLYDTEQMAAMGRKPGIPEGHEEAI